MASDLIAEATELLTSPDQISVPRTCRFGAALVFRTAAVRPFDHIRDHTAKPMEADLSRIKVALAVMSNAELDALSKATYNVDQIAPGLLACLDSA